MQHSSLYSSASLQSAATRKMDQPQTVSLNLRQRLNQHLSRYSNLLKTTAFYFASATFNKTRYCSHIKFISQCLHSNVIPTGFVIANNLNVNGINSQTLNSTLLSCSKRLMRLSLSSFQRSRAFHHRRMTQLRDNLRQSCDHTDFGQIRHIVHNLNSEYFLCLQYLKNKKLERLVQSKPSTARHNHRLVVTILDDLALDEDERAVLSKGLTFISIKQKPDEFQARSDVHQYFRRLRLKAFFHDKASQVKELDPFEALNPQHSNWTPFPEQYPTLDSYICKCEQEVTKLNFKETWRNPNLASNERDALHRLRNDPDIVIKPADKGGAVVVWRKDLSIKEAERQLTNQDFYEEVPQDSLSIIKTLSFRPWKISLKMGTFQILHIISSALTPAKQDFIFFPRSIIQEDL